METVVAPSSWKNILLERISSKQIQSGVIGLGMVGLPLSLEMARAGFDVTGIDIDPVKIETLQSGRSYLGDVPSSRVSKLVSTGKLTATTSFDGLALLDTITICVPTPLRKTGDPDLSFILSVITEIIPRIRHGQLIILESTTYPGTMDEIFAPVFQNAGFEIGKDLFLAYSPEREDPGNHKFKIKTIPRVVGGFSSHCADAAIHFYSQFLDKIIPVSSLKVAEMVKLLENTFRSVNIAMINEIALICNKMGIDIWEVIDAAKTKPFGFMSFYPGPGVGGECIPIDPAYLSWKAKANGFEPRFIDLAGKINAAMPEFVVDRIAALLNERQKPLSGSKILIVGVTYKKDVSDVRESPALDVAKLLLEKGVELMFYDPFVHQISLEGKYFQRVGLERAILQNCDLVVILTEHTGVDYARIVKYSKQVFDTRNAAHRFKAPHLVRL